MIYFSIGLLLVAIALAVMQWLEGTIGQAANRRDGHSRDRRTGGGRFVDRQRSADRRRRRRGGVGPARLTKPAGPTVSGLLERLDRQRDGDLVADDRSTGLQRHVDVDAEVLAVQND